MSIADGPMNDARIRTDDPTVIFLHIGKTAGSTLRRILRKNYPSSRTIVLRTFGRPRETSLADFAALSDEARSGVRLVYGHTPFGIHESVLRPSTYITMTRHPVSLVLSQYAFVRRTPGHRLHHAATRMTLEEYIRSGLAHEMSNSQTRAIAGVTDFAYGDSPKSHLATALANVDRHFAIVGVTERFDESLILFRDRFNWRSIYYAAANVAHRRPQPTPRALELIREYNRNDFELYDHLAWRFQRTIDDLPGFRDELRRFRRRNRLHRPANRLALAFTYTIPRTIKKRAAGRRAAADLEAASSS
jgi:hypothetical protein